MLSGIGNRDIRSADGQNGTHHHGINGWELPRMTPAALTRGARIGSGSSLERAAWRGGAHANVISCSQPRDAISWRPGGVHSITFGLVGIGAVTARGATRVIRAPRDSAARVFRLFPRRTKKWR